MALVLFAMTVGTTILIYLAADPAARARVASVLWRIRSLRERWYLVRGFPASIARQACCCEAASRQSRHSDMVSGLLHRIPCGLD